MADTAEGSEPFPVEEGATTTGGEPQTDATLPEQPSEGVDPGAAPEDGPGEQQDAGEGVDEAAAGQPDGESENPGVADAPADANVSVDAASAGVDAGEGVAPAGDPEGEETQGEEAGEAGPQAEASASQQEDAAPGEGGNAVAEPQEEPPTDQPLPGADADEGQGREPTDAPQHGTPPESEALAEPGVAPQTPTDMGEQQEAEQQAEELGPGPDVPAGEEGSPGAGQEAASQEGEAPPGDGDAEDLGLAAGSQVADDPQTQPSADDGAPQEPQELAPDDEGAAAGDSMGAEAVEAQAVEGERSAVGEGEVAGEGSGPVPPRSAPHSARSAPRSRPASGAAAAAGEAPPAVGAEPTGSRPASAGAAPAPEAVGSRPASAAVAADPASAEGPSGSRPASAAPPAEVVASGSRPASAATVAAAPPAEAPGSRPASAAPIPPAEAAGSRPASAAPIPPAEAAGSRPASAAPIPLAEAAGSRPASAAAAPAPSTGSRPPSATVHAAPAESAEQTATGSRPASAAPPADAPAGSRPASAAPPEDAPAPAGSRPASAAPPAEAPAPAGSRPASAAPPAGAPAPAGSRPASAAPPADAPAGSRPASAAPPADAPAPAGSRPASGAAPPHTSSRPASSSTPRPASGPTTPPPPPPPPAPSTTAAADTAMPLLAVHGLDTHRRNNALLVDDDTLVSAIGSHVLFVSLSTGARRYLKGVDGGGVGAVAVHPSRTLLAVGEKARDGGASGDGPCVYIYSYPELEQVQVLHGGTERGYSALAWNASGDTLASVGSFPDFLLTLWDWRQAAIVLRAKAFSQDVYTVAFSPYFEGQLTTSGQGHIRFWRMAATFTGLKLQGAIGKFGNVELSDVAGFVELPDGKVLSTTESGHMLLWDGGLIKVVLTRPGGRPCHDGPLEVLLHDRASSAILSAGADGYVRLWDFNQVNDAEPREDGHTLELRPLDEVLVAPGAHLVSLLRPEGGGKWVAVDRAGRVHVVTLPAAGAIGKGAVTTCVASFPAGAVGGMALSHQAHLALGASRDGHLRVMDYRNGALLAEASYPQPITSFAPVPGGLGAARPSPAAAAALTGYADGVLRVHVRAAAPLPADGDAAAAVRPSTALVLTGAAKPHKGAVTAIAVSAHAERVVTCGEDGTVFFLGLRNLAGLEAAAAGGAWEGPCGVLVPQAYVRLPQGCGAVLCATWDATGEGVLLGTSRGTILQVPLPPGDLDTHHSFEWVGGTAAVRSYTFCAPKPPKPKKKKGKKGEGAEGGVEGEQAEGEGAQGDEEVGGNEGEGAEGADGGEGAEGGEEEEEAEEEEEGGGNDGVAASTGEVLTLQLAPYDRSELLVTVGGSSYAARKVWRVHLDEPVASPLLEGFPSAPVSYFAYGRQGDVALLGSADGLVRVQPLAGVHGGPAPYTSAWEAPLHDMQAGRLAAVAISWDGAYLVTAAADGAVHLLAHQLSGPVEAQEVSPEPEDLPALELLPPPPQDVTSAGAYTLEEEKQQAERDQQIREAEEKKLSVRERLARIRAEFDALLNENAQQPEALRLNRDDMEVDPGLRQLMEAEAVRREEVARLELAWESERQRLGLAKLRAYFLDNVETERVVLYSLRGNSTVTTFRTAKLSEDMRRELAALRRQQQLEQQRQQQQAAASAAAAAGGEAGGRDGPGGERKPGELGTSVDAATRARLAEATAALEEGAASGKLNKADLRRLARKRREAEWAAFNATKPDESYDSPADLAAIEEAKRTIGDFKLKSDPNYVVPEEERMTPQRKRQAMLELEEALYDTKTTFNKKFFALRDVKRKVLSDIRAKLSALADLAAQASVGLGAAGGGGGAATAGGEDGAAAATAAAVAAGAQHAFLAPFAGLPQGLLPDEEPAEARERVTEEDLASFAARRAEEERKAAAQAAGGLGGFATSGASAPAKPKPGAAAAGAGGAPGAAPAHAGAAGGAPAAATAASGGGGGGLTAAEEALAKMMAAAPPSELEKGLAAYQRRRVEHQRSKLTEEINALIAAFDDAHSALKSEKLGLEADVKAGEMRLLVGFQELQLLREFDKRESVLLQKRQAKMDDKQEIVDKICDCTDKLEQKRLELEGLVARRAAVVAELDGVVPEADAFREALVKVFHRRIKRSKKKAGGGDDEYDSEEEDDDDEMGDDDADEDDDGGEEVCPPGCDQAVYERVCDLREKRLDEEDMIAEFQKTIEVLRKEKEALAKKQRLVEQGLAAVNADMAEFQKEKQGRLNQVEVVVALRMHQIEYLLDGCLPDDLSAALVFSSSALRRLQQRVGELEGDKAALRQGHKELRRQHAALLRDKADKEKKVAELQARAHDVQMLKFGQVIDLELLDKVSSSRGTEELKEDMRRQEVAYARELAEWDSRIAARTDELVALTRENTACLNAVSELTSAQRGLEAGLTSKRKGLFTDPVQQRKAEVEERDALVQLVNAQAQEIDRLKAQLGALRRKDTSMYA